MNGALSTAVLVRVTGVVQGVGFRPFVHRLATELRLDGVVGNDSSGVWIELEGPAADLQTFTTRLGREAPPLALVETVRTVPSAPSGRRGFAIAPSRATTGAPTLIAPDTAVCDACLAEMWDPLDRRYLHPFITCTDCGPRFTIIRRLPYDRPGTTMADFALCAVCRSEYDDPGDRRYHAQPIGCHDCGPTLSYQAGGEARTGASAIVAARRALRAGRILAVKGLGGYHLVGDATSEAAVAELRRRKGRLDKPLAVMAADAASALELVDPGPEGLHLLESPARPIVLLAARTGGRLAPGVAPRNPLLGVVLPYTPLHHLLFCDPGADGPVPVLGPLVVTSSNRSGEPICHRDEDVADRVGPLVDGILAHDRPIHVPCDDSVVRPADGRVLPVRRSRGYAPLPVRVTPSSADVLAVGAESNNVFCVATGGRAWMSQHIGDMANLETLEAFDASVRQFCEMYGVNPDIVAVDAHPGYLASKWARDHHPGAVVEVQHHHAHIAAVMAEHGLDPDEEVFGVAFDGTGYGDDGTIWGGEFLEASALAYRRVGHLAPIPLPGGDAAVRHPWRVALAHLWASGLPWSDDLPPVRHATSTGLRVLGRQLEAGVATVPTTSMGRLFDAVSSLLGVRHDVTYEAQAAIELEHVAAGHLRDAFPLAFGSGDAAGWQAAPVLAGLITARRAGASVGAAAASFHLAVAALVATAAVASRARTGRSTVALGGGVWQNALLTRLCRDRLAAIGFDVRTPGLVPPNDGGLALGQLSIASRRAVTGLGRAAPIHAIKES